MRWKSLLVPVLLLGSACITPAGQKVTVLLTDHTLSCQGDGQGNRTAVLDLAQEDDLFQVPLVERGTGVVRTLAATREGLKVTFTCPDSLNELVVRHATILQSRANTTGESGTVNPGTGRLPPT